MAVGDVTGDGAADIITGFGSDGPGRVRAFDWSTGLPVASFDAFGPSFRGGVYVAAGT